MSLWGPVWVWMTALYLVSAQPDIAALGHVPPWILQGAAYFVLGLLTSRASAEGVSRPLGQGDAVLATLLCGLFGVLDELHRAFVPGRAASFGHAMMDMAGAGLAAMLWRLAWGRAPSGASGDSRG